MHFSTICEAVLGQRANEAAQGPPAPMGININDSDAPWTEMILSGTKTIETRNSPFPDKWIGKRFGMVRTGKGPATVVGYFTLGKPVLYRSQEAFQRDFGRHRVQESNQYWNVNGVKYGYPVLNVTREPSPYRVTSQGRRARKIDRLDEAATAEDAVKRFKGIWKEIQAAGGTRAQQLEKLVDKAEDAIEFDEEEGTSLVPGGEGSAVECTAMARFLKKVVGGELRGYRMEDNPGTKIHDTAEGHDFLVVDGRYIVDHWLKHVQAMTDRAVLDLKNKADLAIVKDFYGDQAKWLPEELWEGRLMESPIGIGSGNEYYWQGRHRNTSDQWDR